MLALRKIEIECQAVTNVNTLHAEFHRMFTRGVLAQQQLEPSNDVRLREVNCENLI